jgi:hypothetical protein
MIRIVTAYDEDAFVKFYNAALRRSRSRPE